MEPAWIFFFGALFGGGWVGLILMCVLRRHRQGGGG